MSGPRVVLVASALAAALPALPVARADEAGQAGASTPAAYPAEPTARPLLVPRGATEAGLALVVERLDLGDGAASAFALAPRVRHAIGPTELAAAAALSLGEVAPAGVRAPTRDRLRALALGARAVLVGRPVLWGLAVGGEPGVRRVLALLRQEFDVAMALAGCRGVADVDRGLVARIGERPR